MEPNTGSQQESKSSIKVNLTAKGEAQVEVKVYEGETNQYEGAEVEVTGNGIPQLIARRLIATIRSLEEQGIKVVGREGKDLSIDDMRMLVAKADGKATGLGDGPPDAIRRS